MVKDKPRQEVKTTRNRRSPTTKKSWGCWVSQATFTDPWQALLLDEEYLAVCVVWEVLCLR